MASRVIVFGYGGPALAALETFARLGTAPVAVVVPANRTGEAVDSVVADAARRGYPVLVQPTRKALAPFLDQIRALRPDFLFVWSYTMLLPAELLSLAPRGGVNLHGASLPQYRGGHALNWTLINGERETAATLHVIDEGVDTGPVFAERRVPIDDDDDITRVHHKLVDAGGALLREWWPRIERGEAVPVPQDDSLARYYPMRTPEDGRVDWTQSSEQVRNLVRALTAPWPGAFADVHDTRVVFRRVTPLETPHPDPAGTVLRDDGGAVVIATGRGALRIDAAEINGMPASNDDLRAAGLREGVRL
jgi:UDP-4-amino-4-deoxy-L-arabinose formyltransferase/UDP-glucuronic acid dehydrogenase (UDP-4-keto-hexauronic acid decarboxylating)